jgi:hypothetical protein
MDETVLANVWLGSQQNGQLDGPKEEQAELAPEAFKKS